MECSLSKCKHVSEADWFIILLLLNYVRIKRVFFFHRGTFILCKLSCFYSEIEFELREWRKRSVHAGQMGYVHIGSV